MKAVGYRENLPVDDPGALEDFESPDPTPLERDLLVRVRAVSVNPLDTMVRAGRRFPPQFPGMPTVLGWDVVGVVEKIGAAVTLFKPGDRVYYAGSIIRPGANSELHAVDERIVALAPKSLTDAQAAAMPLTTITAYELLFDRLGVEKHSGAGRKLLIIGGAGGVGSMLTQLARQLTNFHVIGTASRSETRKWCLDLGAHTVIDHKKPLSLGLVSEGIDGVDIVASLIQTEMHYKEIIKVLKPQGKLGVIDNPKIDALALKEKSLSLHWEAMTTRSSYETDDMGQQGQLLAEVSNLVDVGEIKSTLTSSFGKINAKNLLKAHALIEGKKSQGKIVLEGF
ncbi:zinc-binding alcohol dehydrogenase family protein [Caballeronia sp. 15711]|uniref:zinc-binding alcohol dehydrogenase family protein n=1 Tax=Caballeronia sp. 15711 TaxID=3391029 RepID=UPI0039E313A4